LEPWATREGRERGKKRLRPSGATKCLKKEGCVSNATHQHCSFLENSAVIKYYKQQRSLKKTSKCISRLKKSSSTEKEQLFDQKRLNLIKLKASV